MKSDGHKFHQYQQNTMVFKSTFNNISVL